MTNYGRVQAEIHQLQLDMMTAARHQRYPLPHRLHRRRHGQSDPAKFDAARGLLLRGAPEMFELAQWRDAWEKVRANEPLPSRPKANTPMTRLLGRWRVSCDAGRRGSGTLDVVPAGGTPPRRSRNYQSILWYLRMKVQKYHKIPIRDIIHY